MQTTKATILQSVSNGDGANAGTTERGGLPRWPSAIDTSKRKESRLPGVARFKRNSARSRIDHCRKKVNVPDFSVGKSRPLVRRLKPHQFSSTFCRKNELLRK